MAEPTGLEPATSDVTGRRSNQLNYDSARKIWMLDVRCLMLDVGFSNITYPSIYHLASHILIRLVGTEGFEPPTSSL